MEAAPGAGTATRADTRISIRRDHLHHTCRRDHRPEEASRSAGLNEYLRVRGPLNIAFGGRRYCLSVPGCRAVGATGARPREPLCLDLAGGVFSHVVAAGLDPDGVVHDTVHDRVGVNSGTESLMPIFLGVLGAEHR